MDSDISNKLEAFYTRYKKQVYRKGEILIRADEQPAGIYFLVKGNVKVYIITAKGDEIVLNIFKPLSFFPMSWGVNDSKNSHYYEAMTEVTFWRVPREDVKAFLKKNPDVLYDLLQRLYRGVDGLMTRMSYLMSGNAQTRLITELLIAAKRFGKKTGKEYVFTLSEKDLATQAGLTRETVSREMKILKNKGLVSLQKTVLVVKDLPKLEEELGNY